MQTFNEYYNKFLNEASFVTSTQRAPGVPANYGFYTVEKGDKYELRFDDGNNDESLGIYDTYAELQQAQEYAKKEMRKHWRDHGVSMQKPLGYDITQDKNGNYVAKVNDSHVGEYVIGTYDTEKEAKWAIDIHNKTHDKEERLSLNNSEVNEDQDEPTTKKINEGPRVHSDHKGHHLTNADGEVVQSFKKDREGLKNARQSMYKNFKGLNMKKPEPTQTEDEKMSNLENKLKKQLEEGITVNTTSTNDDNVEDSMTVTAQGEDALELMAMLKMAGIGAKTPEVEAPVEEPPCGTSNDIDDMANMIKIIPLDDEMVEEEADLANAPDEKYADTDTLVNKISGGLNRRKRAFKKAEDGDNPMAVKEDEEDLTETYLREYDEFKVTAPEDSDEGDWEIENIGKWAVKIGSSKETEATADELGFDTELAAELADEAMAEAEDELYDWDLYDEDGNFITQILDEPTAEMAMGHYHNNLMKNDEDGRPIEADKAVKVTDDEELNEDDVEEGLRIVRKSDGKCIGGYCDDNTDKLTGNVNDINDDDDDEDNVDEGAGCKSKKKVKEDIEKQELDIDENELEEFYDYVLKFYGPDQIYDMGATRDMVQQATKEYIQDKNTTWGGGDSLDREKVRDIMIDTFDLELKESTNEEESVNLDSIKKLAGI